VLNFLLAFAAIDYLEETASLLTFLLVSYLVRKYEYAKVSIYFLPCRVVYRIRKWWFGIYTWSLSASAVNAWRLRMMITGKKESFLDFLRELVLAMFAEHGNPPSKKRKSLAEPCEEVRFDGKNHWIVSTELDQKGQAKRRNCKQCTLEGKKDLKSVNMCEKCEMPLHVHCFKKYHVK
jgi:hypothetical protein